MIPLDQIRSINFCDDDALVASCCDKAAVGTEGNGPSGFIEGRNDLACASIVSRPQADSTVECGRRNQPPIRAPSEPTYHREAPRVAAHQRSIRRAPDPDSSSRSATVS